MKLSAVIFDLNGTILKDDHVWIDAYGKVLESLGVEYSKGKEHICGLPIVRNWEILIQKNNIKTDKSPDELSAITNREYLKHLNEIKLNKGFEELAQSFIDSDISISLATSSHWLMVERDLKTFGIENILIL